MAGQPWALSRGATVSTDGTAHFAVWAPAARAVSVVVLGSGRRREVALTPAGDGVFEGAVPDVPPASDYWYRLDGGPDRPDPVSRHRPAGVHGPSRVVDPQAFRWSDAAWTGFEVADLVLYELHVGTFTDVGAFDGVIDELPRLKALGVTAIELMPVAEFPGSRNWGYDGVSLYAPQSTYGGPECLRRLVDAAHAHGLAVVLDVVYNHLGPEGNYLGDFGPYFTDRYRSPWGPAINYDGPDSDEVRRYAIDNALYWVTEFHLDGLRLDAVHAIYDVGARHLLAEMADAVHAQATALGRRAIVIAESDLNDPRLVRPPARGGYDLDAQWSDDLHHAVHAALTGEHDGYYIDFDGAADIAKALRDRFVYDGRCSRHRRRRHGAPACDVPADRVVVFAQNHDQIGNRARGERLSVLVPPPALRVAAALVLLSPYVPMLFMGEEYGEMNPFLYFVSHGDQALVDAVRAGRQREFAEFAWQGDVPDPQAEETFVRSRLDRSRIGTSPHAELLALHRDLIALRRNEQLLRPGTAAVSVEADPSAPWVTLVYRAGDAPPLAVAYNLGTHGTDVPLDGRWTPFLSTDDRCYGGKGRPTPLAPRDGRIHVHVPGMSAAVLRGSTTPSDRA
jgi:maltooligosyltrehalose trehalohydrolase